jgi:hypothetical protein
MRLLRRMRKLVGQFDRFWWGGFLLPRQARSALTTQPPTLFHHRAHGRFTTQGLLLFKLVYIALITFASYPSQR